MQSVFVVSGPVSLSLHQFVPSQSVYRSGNPETGPDHSEQTLEPTDVDDDANAAQLNVTGRIIIIGARYHFPKLSDAITRIIERLQPGLCELSSCALIFRGLLGMGLGNATQAGFRQRGLLYMMFASASDGHV